MKKVILLVILVGVLFTAFMGFAHTKAGRPVLVAIGHIFGKDEFCPLGYDVKVTAEQRAARRAKLASSFAKSGAAEERKFLDFQFALTTRAEVKSWAAARGGACKNLSSDFDVECSGAFFGAAESSFWLEFDQDDRLVAGKGLQKFATAAAAKSLYTKCKADLETSGANRARIAEAGDLKKLESGLLNQALARSDFNNFQAEVRITNMGSSFAVSQNATAF